MVCVYVIINFYEYSVDEDQSPHSSNKPADHNHHNDLLLEDRNDIVSSVDHSAHVEDQPGINLKEDKDKIVRSNLIFADV